MNPLFNTVRDPHLRQVLESDYAELQVTLENGLEKASLVLMGGIVEAVLINFLSVIGYEAQAEGKDPKRMQFAELITACETEGALNAETVALCQALREYRNLVHPGRWLRNDERASSARTELAERLVERVVGAVDERARRRPEWAAEAALENTTERWCEEAAIRRIIRGLPDEELARLVTTVIPDRLAALTAESDTDDEDYENFMVNGLRCFEQGFGLVQMPVKVAAARRLLRDLQAGDARSMAWLKVFCTLDVLAALQGRERDDLISFALEAWARSASSEADSVLRGVGPYLSPAAAVDLAEMVCDMTARSDDAPDPLESGWTLESELTQLPPESSEAARQTVDTAIARWGDHEISAVWVMEMRYRVWPLEDDDIPR